jgi:catechol 2,3-dioxygenase-like lactoylglutathione lyase family enzyme
MAISYRLDHIALLVRDLEETTRFLTEVLQIERIDNPMGGTEIRWFEIGSGNRFHVQQGDISRVHVEKRTHFALSAQDLDAVVAHLNAKGVAFSDMKGTAGAVHVRSDGMRAIFVQDPNGYWFEINDFR